MAVQIPGGMSAHVEPINIADLLYKRAAMQGQEQDNAYRQQVLGMKQQELAKQQRFADLLAQNKGKVTDDMAGISPDDYYKFKELQLRGDQQQAKTNNDHMELIGRVSAGALKQLDGMTPEQQTQALPGIQQQIISDVSSVYPMLGQKLAEDPSKISLDRIRYNAMTHGGYEDPQAKLANDKKRWEEEYKIKKQYGGGADPYKTVIYDNQGNAYNHDARTGNVEPIQAGGRQFQGAKYSAELEKNIATNKAIGKELGEAQGGAQVNEGQLVDSGNYMVDLLDELVNHPGKSAVVGMPDWSDPSGKFAPIPGSPSADFMARWKQVQGKQFLEAFNGLKGAGQITEKEGEKATEAIGRLQTSQSEEAFDNAARELQNIVYKGIQRARNKAKGDFSPTTTLKGLPPGWKLEGGKVYNDKGQEMRPPNG